MWFKKKEEKVKVQFARVNSEAKIPQKREEDAAFDVYACFSEDYLEIHPHKTVMIPTGIASCCSNNYCFILKERGSTGSKGIGLRSGVVDSGYRGEWFVALTNHNDKEVYISKNGLVLPAWKMNEAIVYPYEKAIAQAMVVPVPKIDINEISYEELKAISSERGTGKLGSSNK